MPEKPQDQPQDTQSSEIRELLEQIKESNKPKSMFSRVLEKISTVLLSTFFAAVVLGGGAYYTGAIGSPERDKVDVLDLIRAEITDDADLHRLAAQYSVFSTLVREDGERDTPFLTTSDQVYQKMRNIGFANVGPGWNLGESYPVAVDLIEGFMREQGLTDDLQPLTPELRSAYCRACDYISGVDQ